MHCGIYKEAGRLGREQLLGEANPGPALFALFVFPPLASVRYTGGGLRSTPSKKDTLMSTKLPSRNTQHKVAAKTPAEKSLTVEGGETSDGEGFGVGTTYTAVLNERENKSLNRNAGPERPSANTGKISTVTRGARKTGRV
jgi:hypothetical protein